MNDDSVDLSAPELTKQIIPCKIDLDNIIDGQPSTESFTRVKSCMIIHTRDNTAFCNICQDFEVKREKQAVIKQRHLNTPAKQFAPLSQTHRHRVELALKQKRATTKNLNKEIARMKKEILSKGILESRDMSNDLK